MDFEITLEKPTITVEANVEIDILLNELSTLEYTPTSISRTSSGTEMVYSSQSSHVRICNRAYTDDLGQLAELY